MNLFKKGIITESPKISLTPPVHRECSKTHGVTIYQIPTTLCCQRRDLGARLDIYDYATPKLLANLAKLHAYQLFSFLRFSLVLALLSGFLESCSREVAEHVVSRPGVGHGARSSKHNIKNNINRLLYV